ncbi:MULTISPECIES: hypothetical protein [unclassified Mesorhizobium]|uniref:hypothetical protein n=1 Tax=unclassified Mesorhizobium TaxID=325217 RepID=UPI001651749C|nr:MULTISPECIES: hypothetical protein [unclassified Mesorhizobium]
MKVDFQRQDRMITVAKISGNLALDNGASEFAGVFVERADERRRLAKRICR